MNKSATDRLTNILAKWIVMNCRPTNMVEDEGLTKVLQTVSSDPPYKPPCRTTVTTNISKMYDGKKKKNLEVVVEFFHFSLSRDKNNMTEFSHVSSHSPYRYFGHNHYSFF